MTESVFILAAYLLGSVSFGIVVSRLMGLPDPRLSGSGNPGATNVLRSGKKAAAALTLLGDAGKGWLAVWFAQHMNFTPEQVCMVMAAVFLGHLYPVFYGFKGGKGVATALGILLALNVWVGLAVLATWLTVFAIWRYSSLGALVGSAFAPLYVVYFVGMDVRALTVLLLTLLLIWRHKSNIQKLMNGTEQGFGKKAK